MLIRRFQPGDVHPMFEMHKKMGAKYEFPPLADFVETLVVVNGNPDPVMTLSARKTIEGYLLLDPKAGTPQQRWEEFISVHSVMERRLVQLGFEDAHFWLPPGLERFGKRLEAIGWSKDPWPSYSKCLVGR